MNNKRGRPQKYLFWADWQAWLLKEWYPFKTNDLPHLQRDMAWVKGLLVGVILALIGAAIAVLSGG